MLKEMAISNIEKAIYGDKNMKMRPKEIVDLSFKLLTAIDRDFQPKSQIEVKSMNMNFDVSMEDLKRRIVDISNELNLNHVDYGDGISDNPGEPAEERETGGEDGDI